MSKHWSMRSALEQVESCDFECEGGPLKNNIAWQWLMGAARVGPEFWPGQGVYYDVQAYADGQILTKWTHFYIVGCHMDSDTERRYWTYDLSCDPPAPWHYGTVHCQRVRGDKLSLVPGKEPTK